MTTQVVIGKMQLLGPGPDKCQCCAVKHEAHNAHNQQSLYWLFWFQSAFGRSPTWADAIAHCPEPFYSFWKSQLEAAKVFPPDDGTPPIACVTPVLHELKPSPYQFEFVSFDWRQVNEPLGPFVISINGIPYQMTKAHVLANQEKFGHESAFQAAMDVFNAWVESEEIANG